MKINSLKSIQPAIQKLALKIDLHDCTSFLIWDQKNAAPGETYSYP